MASLVLTDSSQLTSDSQRLVTSAAANGLQMDLQVKNNGVEQKGTTLSQAHNPPDDSSPMTSLVLTDSSQLTALKSYQTKLYIPTLNHMICKIMCLAAVTSDSQLAPKKPWGYCMLHSAPSINYHETLGVVDHSPDKDPGVLAPGHETTSIPKPEYQDVASVQNPGYHEMLSVHHPANHRPGYHSMPDAGAHNSGYHEMTGVHNPGYHEMTGAHNPRYHEMLGVHSPKYHETLGVPNPGYHEMTGLHNPGYHEITGVHNQGYYDMSGVHNPGYHDMSGVHNPGYHKTAGIPNPEYHEMIGVQHPGYHEMIGVQHPGYHEMIGAQHPGYHEMIGVQSPGYYETRGILNFGYGEAHDIPNLKYHDMANIHNIGYQDISGVSNPSYHDLLGIPNPGYQDMSGAHDPRHHETSGVLNFGYPALPVVPNLGYHQAAAVPNRGYYESAAGLVRPWFVPEKQKGKGQGQKIRHMTRIKVKRKGTHDPQADEGMPTKPEEGTLNTNPAVVITVPEHYPEEFAQGQIVVEEEEEVEERGEEMTGVHPEPLDEFLEQKLGAAGLDLEVLEVRHRLQKLDFYFGFLRVMSEDCRHRMLCEVLREPGRFYPLSSVMEDATSFSGDYQLLSSRLINTTDGTRLLSYIEASFMAHDRAGSCGVFSHRCPTPTEEMINYDALCLWREMVWWLTIHVIARVP
uniref:Uncharacterized protein n=1 Tax=Timema shepardi TaxID=629360 RepID=A0A7R9G0A3_TIMSH|nr:unnamed protein product [Timema shepardi]